MYSNHQVYAHTDTDLCRLKQLIKELHNPYLNHILSAELDLIKAFDDNRAEDLSVLFKAHSGRSAFTLPSIYSVGLHRHSSSLSFPRSSEAGEPVLFRKQQALEYNLRGAFPDEGG
ncbi:hypothetical protein E4T56_gene9022 [Termitomyces sp. T112]|nr:hypothetical protein E4T56_gene9022 [Termitomyces sp. T112]